MRANMLEIRVPRTTHLVFVLYYGHCVVILRSCLHNFKCLSPQTVHLGFVPLVPPKCRRRKLMKFAASSRSVAPADVPTNLKLFPVTRHNRTCSTEAFLHRLLLRFVLFTELISGLVSSQQAPETPGDRPHVHYVREHQREMTRPTQGIRKQTEWRTTLSSAGCYYFFSPW